MGVLAAERIKLTTTRSPWWCAGVIALVGLGLPALLAMVVAKNIGNTDGQQMNASVAVSGLSGLGVMIVMIMATLTVTSEYRFGIIRTTFQATPNRTLVLAAKALLTAVLGGVLVGVLGFVAFFLAKAIAGPEAGRGMVLSGENTWRALLGTPYYALLCAVLAVAVGALVRQSAAAIAALMLWPLLVESLVGLFGTVGHNIQPFLPFANMQHFLGDSASSAANWHWGPWGGLIYFTAFVAAVFVAAVVVVNRRDA